jgi:hypothetical protein
MSLLTSIVDLDSIQVNSASLPFNLDDKATEIEALAHTIVELRGLVDIPLVRALRIDEYELVSGHLEYYAFLKAREIDPELPDRITVFILKPKIEGAMLKQLEVIEAVRQPPLSDTPSTPNPALSDEGTLSLKLKNLESRLEQSFKHLSSSIERLKLDLTETIDSKLPQPLPPLEAFNRISEPAVQQQVLKKLEFLSQKKALKIIEKLQEHRKRHPNAQFKQFSDVLGVLEKGTLSKEKMLEVIDRWN